MICFKDNYFFLEGKDISYIFRISSQGYLVNCYFGKKIKMHPTYIVPERFYCWHSWGEDGVKLDEIPQECPTYGHTDLRRPMVSFKGDISVLKYKSHEIYKGKKPLNNLPSSIDEKGEAETLEVLLYDDVQNIEVKLFYTVFETKNTIARHVEITNKAQKDLTIDQCYSMCLDFEYSDFSETHFAGRWGFEREKITGKVVRGTLDINNARGGSGHFMNPYVMLHSPHATETSGDVYSFMLVYSGNHSTVIDTDQRMRTRVLQGINPFGFEWTLKENETFTSPESLLTFSHCGFTGASQAIHNFIKENIVRGYWKDKPRPILINNWEATYMNFNEEKILSIASLAKDLGIELFVLDDGWFGKRNNDDCSLGDWYVNYEKLPSGIEGIAEKVTDMGIKFGLWFEPEMVNPDSDLYRAHPDWAIHAEGISPALSRNQLVLDMSRKDVQDYVIESVVSILKRAKISYVKWDYNRYITDMPYLGYNHAYTLGMYRVTEEITRAVPEVLFEGCSGGGGRFDAGILCYMPQIWTSDNTDPVERIFIQYGTSFGYPTSTMGSHVTASPNHYTGRKTSMKTRGDIALSGNFGYELDITTLPKEDLDQIKLQVEECKKIRSLVQYGDFYRLSDPFEGNIAAWQIVNSDKTESFFCGARILFKSNVYFPVIKLRGLEEGALYKDEHTGKIYSADELMYRGLFIDFPHGDFATYTMHLTKIV
ncbi:MAG: alpha-galactosidase [Clostridia bacterium]